MELLVASGISALVLTGVLAASLQLVRSGVRITQYADMNNQVRRAFEQLATEVKAASDLTLNGTSDVTLTIPESDGTTTTCTYAWNSSSGIFYRVPGSSSAATSGRTTLISGIQTLANGNPGLTFSRLDAAGSAVTSNTATKRLRITVTVSRTATGAMASTSAVTATFTLRNKPVS